MCGIAGIFFFDAQKTVDQASLSAMAERLKHRGPEDEGFYRNGRIGLAHRRLSIVDLAGGHQPLANENETIWVICNGEIFNFPTLRPQLEALGHRFRTHSDSEVLVHLYEQYGEAFAKHLRGQFAFALWDDQKKILMLGRDRMGQKPLYFYQDREKLIFASEMKGILAFGQLPLTRHVAMLGTYLNLGYLPQPHTQYCEIKKIPPAHVLLVNGTKTEIQPYWQHPIPTSDNSPFDLTETTDALDAKLQEATKIRLMSDVPVGAFLSGGVDSSLIVALMAKLSSTPLKTFNISFREKSYDESKYARQMATLLHTEHYEIPVDYRIEEIIEKVLRHFDEPFADSSAIPQYLVSQAARNHVKVVLSGDAGDDIFAGYRRYLGRRLTRNFNRLPKSFRTLFHRLARGSIQEGDEYIGKSLKKMSLRFLNLAKHYEEEPASSCLPFFTHKEMREILTPEIWDRQKDEGLLSQYFDPNEDPVAQMLYLDQRTYFTDDILVKVDRMSMAHALEVRSPFLDHELVEWAANLSLQAKLHGFTGKFIVKKLAERYMPKDLIYRRKQGFAIPLEGWFRRELKDLLHDELFSTNGFDPSIFQPKGLKRIYDDHLNGRRDYSQQLWALLSLRYTF